MTASEDRSSESLVIPLRLRGLDHFFPLFSAGMVVGAVALMVIARSLEAIVWGGATVVTFGWMCVRLLAGRRFPFASPVPLVATADGLRSPWWEVEWDRVDRISIGAWEGVHRIWEAVRPGAARRRS